MYKYSENELHLHNIDGLFVDEEYEDNYDEQIDTSNIKKIKLSEKLKILGDVNPYLKSKTTRLLLSKLMHLTFNEPKFKLIKNLEMFRVENLLPESKFSHFEILTESASVGENKTYQIWLDKYDEYVTDLRLEITINSKYEFEINKFRYSDIFDQFDLFIDNTMIESIDSKIIEFILSKNNQQWIFDKKSNYDTKLVLPLPFSLLSNQNGIFLNKIKNNTNTNPLKSNIRIVIKMCSGELVKNISNIEHIAKYYNYSSIQKLPLKKIPIQYNMDLIKCLSTDPLISNCEVTSLNSIFSTNYWTYQHGSTELFDPKQSNVFNLNFNNYIRGICFVIYDIETKKNITLNSFNHIQFQINGCDHSYEITTSMLKYNMKNFNDFVINESYCYFDFDNFLNFDLINNFKIVFHKNDNLHEEFEGKKFNIDIWGCGANTLLYLEGNVMKIN